MTKREKILLLILAIVLVLSGGYTAFAYRSKIFNKKPASPVATNKNLNSNSNKNLNSNLNSNLNQNSNSIKITPVVDSGVIWIAPEKLANLGLFTDKMLTICDVTNAEYYKVANLQAGGSIVIARMSCGPGANINFRFREDGNGVYYYLYRHNKDFGDFDSSTLTDFDSKTKYDGDTLYASVSAPDALTSDKEILLKKSGSMSGDLFFSELKNATKLGDTNYGAAYKNIGEVSNGIVNRQIYVKLADSTVVAYAENISFVSDDNVPNITLGDGTKNKDAFLKSMVPGCGFRTSVSILANNSDLSTRTQSYGKTPDGSSVYVFQNADDPVIDAAYKFYTTDRENGISKAEFFASKPVFVWLDPFGDYITFLNQNYAPMAECGKPVVYLYPKEPTRVSVKVDARITKSDPEYKNGWDVLANPSGQLILDNKTYDSLYWEGEGKIYPDITTGFVIKRENIEPTLIDHLSRLGLNEKERSDFLDFWLPKMPNDPHIRLTWFGNREMNQLAPLKIDPKPDTIIRVFLDFEGLQKPIDIKPQNLFAPKRVGFVAVEWGGLLK